MTTLNKTETNEVIERFMGILKYVDDVNLLEVVYELLKNPNHIVDLDGFGRYLDKLRNSQNFKIKDVKIDCRGQRKECLGKRKECRGQRKECLVGIMTNAKYVGFRGKKHLICLLVII